MIELLELTPFYVWSYNAPMEAVNFIESAYQSVGASGLCPHCGKESYFRPRANAPDALTVVSAASCEACKGWVLVIGRRGGDRQPCQSVTVYPLGKPNDKIAPEVIEAAKGVADDFSEALRCQWIKAYKACVVMCRRAVQTSALALGAPARKKLVDQIDHLFEKGKITEALKDFAHEVRLVGNRGAHPEGNGQAQQVVAPAAADEVPEEADGLEDVTEGDAKDIVEFTREYLHHVYVMPAKLKARRPKA